MSKWVSERATGSGRFVKGPRLHNLNCARVPAPYIDGTPENCKVSERREIALLSATASFASVVSFRRKTISACSRELFPNVSESKGNPVQKFPPIHPSSPRSPHSRETRAGVFPWHGMHRVAP